jgi:hypothetical protein
MEGIGFATSNRTTQMTYPLSPDEINFILQKAGIGSQSWNSSSSSSSYQAVDYL